MNAEEHTLLNVVVILLAAEVALAVVATAYVLRIFRKARSASVIFRDLVITDVVSVAVGVALLVPALAAVLDLPRLPYTGLAVVLAIMLLLSPPITHAWRMWRLRRADPTPNPDVEEDHG